jgi:SAM-dependent methyltransferase
MMVETTKDFWNKKYRNNKTGWDIGAIATPIKEYIDQLDSKNLTILIPGSGNSWEAEYLFQNQFMNTNVIDISKLAIKRFTKRFPQFPSKNIFEQNFFDHTQEYDLIVEHTFFCALTPNLRSDYVKKMHLLLKPQGKLVGLLFDRPLNKDHPPFGGSLAEYWELFEPYFQIKKMEPAKNSIPPRKGSELFILLIKKEITI